MHHKGTKHGSGSARRAIDYLLQDHDSSGELRGGVDVLRGDPMAVADLADSLDFKWRYSSSVVGWALEEDPTPEEIEAVLNDIEAAYFAGIPAHRVQWCAVLHTGQDGRKDLHIVTACVDLESGLHFNPLPPGHMRLMDAMRDYHNWSNGWARPDDPARAVLSQVGRAQANDELPVMPRKRADMHAVLDRMIDDGLLATSADVRAQAKQWGEVTREGTDYISIKPPGAGRAVRLKGEKFKKGWTAAAEPERQARKQQVRNTGRGGVVDHALAAEARALFNQAVAGRAAHNQKRYPASPAIDPLQVMAQFRAEQQVQNERDRAVATAAANAATAGEAERNQRVRATTERAVAAAGTATGAAERTAAGAGRAAAAARAATAELAGVGGPLRAIAAFCREAIQRLRAAVEQRLGGGVAVSEGAPAADRRVAADSGGWAGRIAAFSEWATGAAASLNAVVVPDLQPERQGAVFMSATSAAPYQPPSAEKWAELMPELGAAIEPTPDELAELMPDGMTELLEHLDEQPDMDEDEIDLDGIDDGPSGPNFG